MTRPLLAQVHWQRNRASRRGGQLLTRALGSSCVSACPHFGLPVPLSRWSHHTPRCRTPQPNLGTEKSHIGYQPDRKRVRDRAATDGAHKARCRRLPARLMVFKLVIAASKTWRRLKGTNQLPEVVVERSSKCGTPPDRLVPKSRIAQRHRKIPTLRKWEAQGRLRHRARLRRDERFEGRA